MICIDSNIIIYSARKDRAGLRRWLANQVLSTSIISKVEVLGYYQIAAVEIDAANRFFALCEVLPLTEKIVNVAIQLRQEKKMSLGDSIIAATAITNNLPLLTANTKDFKHISTLDLISLDEIER